MHLAISLLGVMAVAAVVILPAPLAGLAIQRRRRRRALQAVTSYSLEPTACVGEVDPLPSELRAALRVEGFLSEEEHDEAMRAAGVTAGLDEIHRTTMLQVNGVIDSAVDRLTGGAGRAWVQLNGPES